MAEREEPLRVLIAGAGIGGLATAISLSRVSGIQDLDIQLYEQAPELGEIGASIALSPNGMRTLEKLGVHNALAKEIGFRGPSGIPQIFRYGHNRFEAILPESVLRRKGQTLENKPSGVRGHPPKCAGPAAPYNAFPPEPHTCGALLEHVPRNSIHLGKRVDRAEASNDGVALFFDDGSSAHGDILIGADGIRSKVRQSFLPQHKLKFSGKIFMRSTFDASLVDGNVPQLPADAVHWLGPNGSFSASRLGKGQYTTVGAYNDERSTEELADSIIWDQPGDVHFFREKYKGWNPVVEALTETTPNVRMYPNYVGEALNTWILAPRVVLLGDAAHAHGGAFAAGGSLALDDALALGLSFSHFPPSGGSQHIQRALELYDRTRRPHVTRLVSIVHEQIDAKAPAYSTLEEEGQALIARLRSRPNLEWLSEHDVEEALLSVLEDWGMQIKAEELEDSSSQREASEKRENC